MRQRIVEGMVVAVPATDGRGVIPAVVARVEEGRSLNAALLLYFFGHRFDRLPQLSDVHLNPTAAVSVVRTGAARIVEGKWPVVGMVEGFNKQNWPIPIFAGISGMNPKIARLVEYSSNTIGKGAVRREWFVNSEEAKGYAEDASWGVDVAAYEATAAIQKMEGSAG